MFNRPSLLTTAFMIPAGLMLPLSTTLAADVLWDNPGTGFFIDGTNWDTDAVPTDLDNAFITNGGTAQLQADDFASVNILRVQSGAIELTDAFLTTGMTSSSWQSPGDLQLGGIAGQTGSLTASGASEIVTGRVRIGGWNDAGTDTADMHGTLTMSGSSRLTTGAGHDFWLGNGAGSTATLTMSGTAEINVNNSGTSARAGGEATATLTGQSKFITAGTFAFGEGGTANWTVKESAVLDIGGNVAIAEGNGSNGTLTVQGTAAVSAGDQLFVGNGGNAVGILNIEGGTVTSASWIAVGREESSGTLNVSGGSLTKEGEGTHFVTNGNAGRVATINHTGGTITNIVSEMQLSERTANVTAWTASGGTGNFGDFQIGRAGSATVTISDSANYTATTLRLGVDASATGVLNLNGGTFTANSVSEVAGNGTINFNGGTLRAGAASADFISGFEAGDVVIQAGGAVIDTNSFSVQITLALVGDGGILKTGDGVLTLSGANTYLGDTAVVGGELTITSGFLSDTGNIGLESDAKFNLNFVGVDVVNALIIDGVVQETGTWGALESGAQHESALFTGTGMLNVTSAVPEPSTIALVIAGVAFAGWRMRRRS